MTGMVEILGVVALWLACQLPFALLLGRCLRYASEQDFPRAEREPTVQPTRRRHARRRVATTRSDMMIGGCPILVRPLEQDARRKAAVPPTGFDW
ncbi:MAG TPA: hypothetical protein VMW18_12955 [Candidatus Binatia bacterium]|nr:hypothetical protein [Candidatus Binatia bacterium]